MIVSRFLIVNNNILIEIEYCLYLIPINIIITY